MSNFSCGFETFEHTADIGLRIWAGRPEELLVEAGRAFFSVITDISAVGQVKKLTVRLKAESCEELLMSWLKELLFIFDTKHLLLSEFKIRQLNNCELVAEVAGEVLDRKKHTLGPEIKGITRHQFKLTEKANRYVAEVILDI